MGDNAISRVEDWRCVHCKLVVKSVEEPEICPECRDSYFVKCDRLDRLSPNLESE